MKCFEAVGESDWLSLSYESGSLAGRSPAYLHSADSPGTSFQTKGSCVTSWEANCSVDSSLVQREVFKYLLVLSLYFYKSILLGFSFKWKSLMHFRNIQYWTVHSFPKLKFSSRCHLFHPSAYLNSFVTLNSLCLLHYLKFLSSDYFW